MSSIEKQYHEIEQTLTVFIKQAQSATVSPPDIAADEQVFTALALEIFRFQYQNNKPYQQWCRHLGVNDPAALIGWQQIPAVPTSAFKDSGLRLNCFEQDKLQHVFKTSGTTNDQQRRGEHGFYSVELYHQSILSAWSQLQLPKNLPHLFLTQKASDAPHSSLCHMMDVLGGSGQSGHSASSDKTSDPYYISAEGQLELARLMETCHSLGQPALLLGTALALLKLIEELTAKSTSLTLPAGSALFETGGYKGSGRHLDKADFYRQLEQTLSIPSELIFNEYSMTELSSQFYTKGIDQAHTGPHWTRIQIIDPVTREPVAAGQSGHLQILDLANLGSVAAIRTEDLAIATDSPRSFHLQGRDPSALPRGCSRSADEMLNSAEHQ
ncbi:MAG: hypothetical protein QM496_05905 [Verrucomicrobiota bacterium]